MVFKSIVLSIVLSLILILPTMGQNKKGEDLMRYYRLKSDSINLEIDNQAQIVLNNQIRYVGNFNLSGRIESSNLVLSDDTLFVSKRDTIICFNGKTGERYWAKKHKNRSNGEMLNTKSTLILTDYRAFKGISKRTGELVWNTKEYNIHFSKYNKQKDLIFLSNDTTKVGLDASSGEKKWEYKGNYFVLLDTEDNLLIGISQDTLFGVFINNQQTKWKYTEEYFESIHTCGDNLLLRSYNDSIITLNKETGKLFSKKFKKYERNIFDLTFTQRGVVKKTSAKNEIFLEVGKSEKLKWTYEIPNNEQLYVLKNRCIGSDENNLYISTEQGKLRAINLKNGKLLWEFDTYSKVTSNIVVGNGVLYFVNVSGQVIAVDTNLKDGVQKWSNLRDFE
jgi:outer membrane protein assembly factor BamB